MHIQILTSTRGAKMIRPNMHHAFRRIALEEESDAGHDQTCPCDSNFNNSLPDVSPLMLKFTVAIDGGRLQERWQHNPAAWVLGPALLAIECLQAPKAQCHCPDMVGCDIAQPTYMHKAL